MACYYPREAWKALRVNQETGRRPLVFRPREGFNDLPSQVPCGQCLGCRLDWAADWAARCEKESKLHERNCFITLTYNDENLPIGGTTRSTLSKRDFQLFMKRLRFAYPDNEIRFFATGEYGDKNQRAHYHAILFNHDFPDKQLWKPHARNPLYVSASLERLWGHGFTSVGSVSFQSAAYVARYVVKKLKGSSADYADREPPFCLMSLKPGIGSDWYDRFKGDIYPHGQLVVGEGKTRPTPRYFDRKFEKENPDGYKQLKAKRRAHAKANPQNNTPQRLHIKAQTKQALLNQLTRSL